MWNDARRSGDQRGAKGLKGARYALWKNPGDLTQPQQVKLAWMLPRTQAAAPRLRAEGGVPQGDPDQGRPRLPPARRLAGLGIPLQADPVRRASRKIRRRQTAIENMLERDLSNALIESIIALAMLALGGYRPDLPGRLTA